MVVSPSVSGLSELMQVCGFYGLNHDIKNITIGPASGSRYMA